MKDDFLKDKPKPAKNDPGRIGRFEPTGYTTDRAGRLKTILA